jgi:hypothetical protein
MTHTKGPWEAIYWRSGKGIHVMSKDILAGHVCSIRRKENANFVDDGRFIATAPQMRQTLLQISGIVLATWGDYEGEPPAGIQEIFDALEKLDEDCPDWK